MSNLTTTRLGQFNLAGDTLAGFLKIFGGEIIVAFQDATAFLDKHFVRTIPHGKSAQFPVFGRTEARYHTPGTFIPGTPIAQAERVITIDDLLIADTSVASIDDAMAHFDYRAPFAQELGQALARTFDRNVAQVGVLTARSPSTITGMYGGGGTVLTPTAGNPEVDGELLASLVFQAGVVMDNKFVPEANRYCFVRPAQYALLAQTPRVTSKDTGGQGSYADGSVVKINGITLVKTVNLPSTNITTGPTKYQGDFTKTVALVMHPTAVGTVKLLDLAVETSWLIQNQAWLMVAKYAMGHGILRPESAVEISRP